MPRLFCFVCHLFLIEFNNERKKKKCCCVRIVASSPFIRFCRCFDHDRDRQSWLFSSVHFKLCNGIVSLSIDVNTVSIIQVCIFLTVFNIKQLTMSRMNTLIIHSTHPSVRSIHRALGERWIRRWPGNISRSERNTTDI